MLNSLSEPENLQNWLHNCLYKSGLFLEHRRVPAIQSTLIASRLLTMAPCLHWADVLTIYVLISYQEIQVCIYSLKSVMPEAGQVITSHTTLSVGCNYTYSFPWYLLLPQDSWFDIFPPYFVKMFEILPRDTSYWPSIPEIFRPQQQGDQIP